VHATPPIFTSITFAVFISAGKPAPVTVTTVPPAVEPEVGLTLDAVKLTE